MWLMLQRDEPRDYVIATGEMTSVGDFARAAFAHVGLDADDHVQVDPNYFRPAEVDALCGDASRAQRELGWTAKVRVPELAQLMVDADSRSLADEQAGRLIRVDR